MHLVHLATISIDPKFIRGINWDNPMGLTIYIRDEESVDGQYNTIFLDKNHPQYSEDRKLLAIAVGRPSHLV